MKKVFFNPLLTISLLSQVAMAQVPKKTVVEHFTNTKCSICASRNPGFYTNLDAQPDVLHLAIHPSSPYSGCLLYQQNAIENDARTNYYGIYGGTPRLVINGNVISASANYADNALFSPYQSLTSPASITIRQKKYGNDSIRSTVVVKTVASHSLGSLAMFVALAEDTLFYTGSNGESRHYDVFRKSMGPVSGLSINLPANVGDSVVFTAVANKQAPWDFNRIYTLAILQESQTKNLVQAGKYNTGLMVNGIERRQQNTHLAIYPNPSHGQINIEGSSEGAVLELLNALGQRVFIQPMRKGANNIYLSGLASGIYIARLTSADGATAAGRLLLLAE